ncbi:MAG: bifunctional tetrahydrofolate synthase/dihydrofolate synthase [Gammaproteobacteria bacterium]|nr:bifunctional tetrahydrofolate synthase/dihydrofolate synthase [Gammaproteobacteria bacterium]
MRFQTLADWLDWQERLNPRGIELGLARVRQVLDRLDLRQPDYRVLTIAGTNGKGSTASYAAAILQQHGLRTGRYLSPHIQRYNERIAIDGVDASDDALCAAFAAVDEARGDIQLTYFEFGTLAALWLFREREVDVAVLEVGLGGRLDAVNAVDPDVAAVVSVGLDHMDWLGDDIETIGSEKAGIFRRGRPALYAGSEPPHSVRARASATGANFIRAGEDYHWKRDGRQFDWWDSHCRLAELPLPALLGDHQLGNASLAIACVVQLLTVMDRDVAVDAVGRGLAAVRLPGRLQQISEQPEILLDAGHNRAAAEMLAAYLAGRSGRRICLLGMLADKNPGEFRAALEPVVDEWWFVTLGGTRGQTAETLAGRAGLPAEIPSRCFDDMAEALEAFGTNFQAEDCLLVTGSFQTVQLALDSGLYSAASGQD